MFYYKTFEQLLRFGLIKNQNQAVALDLIAQPVSTPHARRYRDLSRLLAAKLSYARNRMANQIPISRKLSLRQNHSGEVGLILLVRPQVKRHVTLQISSLWELHHRINHNKALSKSKCQSKNSNAIPPHFNHLKKQVRSLF